MLQGESLVDTMLQLSWESLQEGKAVLAEVDKVGDKLTSADVLLNTVEMQMLGIREGAAIKVSLCYPVEKSTPQGHWHILRTIWFLIHRTNLCVHVLIAYQATIEDAKVVFEKNSCQRMLAKCDQLSGRVSIFERDYKNAKLQLEASNRRLIEVSAFVFNFFAIADSALDVLTLTQRVRSFQSGIVGGVDQAETMWFLAIALRLAGEVRIFDTASWFFGTASWLFHSYTRSGFALGRSNKAVTCSRKLLRFMKR